MTKPRVITRGEFIRQTAAAGAGLVIGFHLPFKNQVLAASKNSFAPNVWLTVAPDGLTTIIMHRCEMGQNIWTTLPLIVAEEMDADWSKVKVRQGDLD
ncbi:MAG: molybdopterin-dependent oxidoreductase [Candidatus Marinimicrobia bacterium]|nr:molybdopterin-dependent oxidoreductase [Candidatus Neomarinimicrobiota bacterium]